MTDTAKILAGVAAAWLLTRKSAPVVAAAPEAVVDPNGKITSIAVEDEFGRTASAVFEPTGPISSPSELDDAPTAGKYVPMVTSKGITANVVHDGYGTKIVESNVSAPTMKAAPADCLTCKTTAATMVAAKPIAPTALLAGNAVPSTKVAMPTTNLDGTHVTVPTYKLSTSQYLIAKAPTAVTQARYFSTLGASIGAVW